MLAPLWGGLFFVWGVLILGPRWCSIQSSCVYEAAILLVLSLMAMEYGWLHGKMLGIHDKLQAAGVSPFRLYLSHLGVWAFFLGLPGVSLLTCSYGLHVGIAVICFLLAPLTSLAAFLWKAEARLFHFLFVFIPLQLPYFLLLQGVVECDDWLDPCLALVGATCIGMSLMGLALPSVPSVAVSSWQYCPVEFEPVAADGTGVCS